MTFLSVKATRYRPTDLQHRQQPLRSSGRSHQTRDLASKMLAKIPSSIGSSPRYFIVGSTPMRIPPIVMKELHGGALQGSWKHIASDLFNATRRQNGQPPQSSCPGLLSTCRLHSRSRWRPVGDLPATPPSVQEHRTTFPSRTTCPFALVMKYTSGTVSVRAHYFQLRPPQLLHSP